MMHALGASAFLAAALVFGCGAPSVVPAATSLEAKAAQLPGRMGVHGMIVFGAGHVFMSHIPMFKEPHDFQLLIEVELPDVPDRPPSFAGELYTFEPKAFSLDALRKGELRGIDGTLFRGNFEDGGQPVLKDVHVAVKRIVGTPHPLVDAPASARVLAYTVVGTKDEAYVFHPISKGSDFDQIAAVHIEGVEAGIEDLELLDGLDVVVTGHANDVVARLIAGSAAKGYTKTGRHVTITGDKELSCLLGPDFATACH